MNKCFLTELKKYDNNIEWEEYYENIYRIFINDFINKNRQLYYNGKKVQIRRYPLVGNKEQTFFHITNYEEKDIGDRVPDWRRCERIEWVRLFIENYFCNNKNCKDCTGIHNWTEPYKNIERTYIWSESKRFLVVLEERKNYYLLITAFYVNKNNEKKINNLKKSYQNYAKTEKINS